MKVFLIFCVYFGVSIHTVSTCRINSRINIRNGVCNSVDLSNLGSTINQQVRSNLAHLDNLHSQIQHEIYPLHNLGSEIQREVQDRLGGLEHLGADIEEQVNKNLEPLRAMALRLDMISGVGGKTVITYPNGNTMIAKNGELYKCGGAINNNGDCEGSLSPVDFNKKENYCYTSPNVVANNYLCFSRSSQGLSISVINGHVECSTQDNKPYLLISVEDYKKMCKNLGGNPTYTYFADINNSRSIESPNPLLKCMNKAPNVCVFQ